MSGMSYSSLNSTPNYGGFTQDNIGCNSENASYSMSPITHTTNTHKTYHDSRDINMVSKLVRCESSDLMKEFFSESNMKRLQKTIKTEVYKRSDGRFRISVDQDKQDLILAMEGIYAEHGRNLPTGIVRQTKFLNKKLIGDIIPGILTAIKQYYGYMKDISTPIQPIPRPMNVNNAGRQELPSITTLWQDRGYGDDTGSDY